MSWRWLIDVRGPKAKVDWPRLAAVIIGASVVGGIGIELLAGAVGVVGMLLIVVPLSAIAIAVDAWWRRGQAGEDPHLPAGMSEYSLPAFWRTMRNVLLILYIAVIGMALWLIADGLVLAGLVMIGIVAGCSVFLWLAWRFGKYSPRNRAHSGTDGSG